MSQNDYSPSRLVTSTHNILHLNSRLQSASHTFNITHGSYWNDYTKSLLPIPIICATLGVLAILTLQISLLISICCHLCRCAPHTGEENAAMIKRHRPPHYNRLSFLFFVASIFTLLVVQVLFIGRSFITDGAHNSQDTVTYISNVFNSLVDYATLLSGYGDSLQSDFQAAYDAGCAPAQALESYMSTYESYLDDYSGYVDPVPNQLSNVNDSISLWGIKYQNYTIWAIYFLIILCLVVFYIGYFCKSKLIMRFGIGYAELILIPLFLLVGLEMIVMMGLSDFCMEPATYAPALVPSDIYNVTTYYTTCTGVNPIASVVSESDALLTTLQQETQKALAACPSASTYLNSALTTLHQAEITFTNISTTLDCPPTQSEILDFLQSSLCVDVFKGFYTVWIGQYLACGFLLFTTIIIAVIYQYFGAYWDKADEPIQGNYYDYDNNEDTGVSTTHYRNPAARHSRQPEDYNF